MTIVLAVSFIRLGIRSGFVMALLITLVLATSFLVIACIGISLDALIIALGLLIDDAMMVVEMMVCD